MPPTPKTKAPKEADAEPSNAAQSQLTKYLNANKAEHFNYIEDVNYRVSSGSLNLDVELGGFQPSLVRLVGPSSAGKTSFAFGVAKEFFKELPQARAVYIKAEGRLSEDIQTRTGLTFTKDPEQWANGNVFVFESNVYEVVIGLIRDLITNNPNKHIYLFILDSMDGLNLRGDMAKAIDEANRVAGAPLMTKQFLQKVGIAMSKHGHLCFFLSQVSAEIKLDPYAKGTPRQVGGSGGSAVQHFASHVLEFQNWYESDLILKKPDERLNRLTNPALGHMCKIKIVKTDKEKRYTTVEIPIKHYSNGSGGIWMEREIADQMLMWQLVTKAGSWLTISTALANELESKGIPPLPEKVQGLNQLHELLEERKDVADYLFNKFRSMVASAV